MDERQRADSGAIGGSAARRLGDEDEDDEDDDGGNKGAANLILPRGGIESSGVGVGLLDLLSREPTRLCLSFGSSGGRVARWPPLGRLDPTRCNLDLPTPPRPPPAPPPRRSSLAEPLSSQDS